MLARRLQPCKAAPFRFVRSLPHGFAMTSGLTTLHFAALHRFPPSHCHPLHAPPPPPHVYICEFWLLLQLLPFVNSVFTFGNVPYRCLWGILLASAICSTWNYRSIWLYLQLFSYTFVNYICKFCSLMGVCKIPTANGRALCS